MGSRTGKTILIGLDGASLDLLLPLVEAGQLPGIARIVSGGSYGRLESVVPPITFPAWTSLCTGVGPGTHGIFSFVKVDRDHRATLLCSRDKRAPEIWDYLADREVISAHMPLTFPPSPINGLMVSDLRPSGDAPYAEPPTAMEEIERLFPGYEFDVDLFEYEGREPELKEKIREVLEGKTRFLDYLLGLDCDLFSFVFLDTDRAQHIFWGDEFVVEVYRTIDEKISQLVDLADSEGYNLVLVSDHGCSDWNRSIYLYDFLEGIGVLELDETGKAPDWPRTRAFCLDIGGCIYINDDSRYSDSAVRDGEVESLKKRIAAELLSLRDADGSPLVQAVFDAAEVFEGSCRRSAPDLAFIPVDGCGMHLGGGAGKVTGPEDYFKGAHWANRDGIFMAYGPGIKQAADLRLSILDVTPTLLHMMGEPVPLEMEGTIAVEILEKRVKPRFVSAREHFAIKQVVRSISMEPDAPDSSVSDVLAALEAELAGVREYVRTLLAHVQVLEDQISLMSAEMEQTTTYARDLERRVYDLSEPETGASKKASVPSDVSILEKVGFHIRTEGLPVTLKRVVRKLFRR
ncbi:MAG: alkaline phosphatase family protein [Actinomycetota bacterium]